MDIGRKIVASGVLLGGFLVVLSIFIEVLFIYGFGIIIVMGLLSWFLIDIEKDKRLSYLEYQFAKRDLDAEVKEC